MVWKPVIDPLDHLIVSALVAVIAMLVIFLALILKKKKGYQANLLIILVALLIAISIYKMQVRLAILSIANRALYGLLYNCWIIIDTVFLDNLTVKNRHIEITKHFMESISSDRQPWNRNDLPALPGHIYFDFHYVHFNNS